MAITEAEAKTKWCPQMASHSLLCDEQERVVGNDIVSGVISARCLGSACMAWRRHTYESNGQIFSPKTETYATGVDEHEGFCGLAGKP